MDWTPLLQALVALLAATVPLLVTQVFRLVEERLRASVALRLGDAAKRAAGSAAIEILDNPATAAALGAVRDAAIERAAATLAGTMAGPIAKLGGSPAQVTALVRGELGRLLAVAPAAPGAAPAPGPPG